MEENLSIISSKILDSLYFNYKRKRWFYYVATKRLLGFVQLF